VFSADWLLAVLLLPPVEDERGGAVFVAACLLGAVAVALLAAALLEGAGAGRRRKREDQKDIFTLFRPVLGVIAPLTAWLLWPRYRRWCAARLTSAGLDERVSVEELWALRFVLLAVVGLVSSLFSPLLRTFAFTFAAVFPELWVIEAIKQRHKDIRQSMPQFVDLLALCTGAGLEFGSAMDRVLARMDRGALSDEFRRARHANKNLGIPHTETLQSMARRVNLPELTSFVAILVQAFNYGAGVGAILDSMAEKMRLERMEKAERMGAQAQQKILLPIMLLIVPAFILLVVVPIMIDLFRPVLSGGMLNLK
jgi:tight adherence protein C